MTTIAVPPLRPLPDSTEYARSTTSVIPTSNPFLIPKGDKSYKHQYSNIYFVRLRLLREAVEEKAKQKWGSMVENPVLVPRVLEVSKSQICYIIGTVYMNMPLKPNVIEDIARDHSIPPPPPPRKIHSAEDDVMLEDESGRIRLVGKRVQEALLVTGVIMGALGLETPDGDFEVVDICFAGLAPEPLIELEQPEGMELDEGAAQSKPDEYIAIVSGLNVGAPSPSDAAVHMLVEYLTGEGGTEAERSSAANISRLIIAGNSLSTVTVNSKGELEKHGEEQKPRRAQDDTTTFSAHPIRALSAHLHDTSKVMPIHILPGEADPAGIILPQQPFPRAMFGDASKSPLFSCETNPCYLHFACAGEQGSKAPLLRTLLVTSGQPLNDMFKYVVTPPHTRLGILESTLRWRHIAPTAPDTLWCHPYFTADPFIMSFPPDIYIVGGQKQFGTRLVETPGDSSGESDMEQQTRRCRIILVPEFSTTGTLVLLNLRSMDVQTIHFGLEAMAGGGEFEDDARTVSPSPTEFLPSETGASETQEDSS
ncbi:hypothetical protein BDN72DRAFT_315682 [Pluteus cervinus]|uniref:Uncharacterized protein n=1 Tax=Pluteus cervinus TaxID=181527 RepID=A0ACD3B3E8_9AGAR|nr:hypothetical protein BDN72DRAFT_315682 [Pluteus cervinus]